MPKLPVLRFKRKYSRRGIAKIALAISFIILTIAFGWINIPQFYTRETPETFGFFSDANSYYKGLTYDKCSIEAINDSVSDNADFYFGFHSNQLEEANENTSSNFIYMYYGNNKIAVQKFNEELLNNNIPDVLTAFPFDVSNLGRAYRKMLFYSNGQIQSSIDVDLGVWSASHYGNKRNTIITELKDIPTINEFRFTASNVFKQVSFDTKVLNVHLSNEWMLTTQLMGNQPTSFNVTLKIPKSYVIQDIDKYWIVDNQDSTCVTLTFDLAKQGTVNLVIVDSVKTFEKDIINLVWAGYVLALIATIIYEKIWK